MEKFAKSIVAHGPGYTNYQFMEACYQVIFYANQYSLYKVSLFPDGQIDFDQFVKKISYDINIEQIIEEFSKLTPYKKTYKRFL
ncbi:MAG: hypothetical protein ACHQ1D_01575 [Nitrososphaerales archaeon]